ncbi:transmembrane protein, putative (macronuclear) [Tetrahymena thermophila SB210]|uniref:Transmembrane protein, putative n=1 Tax=Tetrahymena thermophila (strain SB210) TaxID=312017 RepID=Q23QY1_TETTS|nr:transmembrane protein, putative [Tetrahymena thermophila SB210]EAR98975.1 transmembrane protein, putative [Tetrahymena thermophila SB210]|eukprot:XP_001019220.1 transmembrane protein, putative [Tetrahymena thermophila SB210]
MRFVAFALVALIAISYVNADITNVDPYKKCTSSSSSSSSGSTVDPCSKASNPTSCTAQLVTFGLCMAASTNCVPATAPDVASYITCYKACQNANPDAKIVTQPQLDCLSGSFLASAVMILLSVVALLF